MKWCNFLLLLVKISIIAFLLSGCQKPTPEVIPLTPPDGFSFPTDKTPTPTISVEATWQKIGIPFCLGNGVPYPNAPVYTLGQGEPLLHIYEVIDDEHIVYSGDGFFITAGGPYRSAHLIVCIDLIERDETVKNCRFSAEHVVMIHSATYEITMYSLKTGELVRSETKTIPARCPETWTFITPGPKEFEITAHPTYNDYIEILKH